MPAARVSKFVNVADAEFQIDMYTATRATLNDAFSNVAPLSALDTTMNEFSPTVNAAETTLVFARSIPYGLFIATRQSAAATFTSAAALSAQ